MTKRKILGSMHCTRCNGSGHNEHTPCVICNGQGKIHVDSIMIKDYEAYHRGRY